MTAYPHSIEIAATYSPEEVPIIYESLLPEAVDLQDERSQTTLERHESELQIVIAARDLIGLRAALNTWMQLLRVAERSLDIHASQD